MNYIYISIVLVCVIIIICLFFYFSRKKTNEAFSSSYLTKDELTNIIKEKLTICQSVDDSSIQFKYYFNLDNTFKLYEIKNCIVQGTSTGTYNIISENNNTGSIDIHYIDIYDSPNIESRFNKNHSNSYHKTKKAIWNSFTLYQQNRKGHILSFKGIVYNNTQFITVFPQERLKY